MSKTKKLHKEKVAKRNAKITREKNDLAYKIEKFRKLITETAMAQSHKLTEEIEAIGEIDLESETALDQQPTT